MTIRLQPEHFVQVIRPVIRLALRHAYPFQDFINLVKRAYVEVALQELEKTTEKINVSRISAMTGVHRKDVTKLYKTNEALLSENRVSITSRVIGQWEQDKTFTTASGRPRVLDYTGEDSEFSRLVEKITKSIHPGTILFELERMGSVEKTPNGVKLVKKFSRLRADPEKSFNLLSRDVDSLITAVEENTLEDHAQTNLHIRTSYDNIYQKELPKIRKWLTEEGKKFHKRARTFLSKFDQDINPSKGSAEDAGGEVVITAFSLTSRAKKDE